MTRRRRVPLVSRVCIGVFVLLFSTVTADTTKSPLTSSEKQLTDTLIAKASLLQSNKTILNRIPSGDGSSQFAALEKKNEPVTNDATKRDVETLYDELTEDVKGGDEEEKVSMPIDEDGKQQEIRSREQLDRLSAADSANGGSKLDEITRGTSGKGSSRRALSEDFDRQPRTNGLSGVTVKPSAEDSKADEKRNKTVHGLNGSSKPELSSTTAKLGGDVSLELTEGNKAGNDSSTGRESSSKEALTNSELRTAGGVANDSVPEGIHFLDELQQRKKKSEGFAAAKNSEVPDLKEADNAEAQLAKDGSISLVNDTYVNYSYHKITTTERSLGGNESKAPRNTTELIPTANTASDESRDPKEEVEVVANVTDSAIKRIVEFQNSTQKDASLANGLSQRSNRAEDSLRDSTKVESGRSIEQQEEVSEKRLEKLVETSERTIVESSTFLGASSPVPRGRTIAFSGVNEFSSLDVKPTLASKLNVSFSKKNLTVDKPYPYVKSFTKEQSVLNNNSNQVDIATEDVSALKNTIGKGQSGEKFIVTEASDVLENSIQQFKPIYYDKGAGNDNNNESSTVSNTEARSSLPMTTMSLVRLQEVIPTNETVAQRPGESGFISSGSQEKVTSSGNDVPRWSESREAITGNFDVTGNGITEVSLKPENPDRPYEASLQEIRTTPIPLTTVPPEPQTDLGVFSTADVPGSSLVRSTLNATEQSTEYPLIQGNFSDKEKPSTVPTTTLETTTLLLTTMAEEAFTGNATEPPLPSDVDGTNEIPRSASGTSAPEETLPTTTGIEYEVVTLSSESTTTFVGRNFTEDQPETRESPDQPEGTSVPTVHDFTTQNASYEATTITNEAITDNSFTTTETETTNASVTDQAIVPTSMPSPTAQSKDEFTTLSSAVEETDESSTKEEVQKTATESWDTTSETVIMTTERTGQTIARGPKDFVMENVTEGSVEFTSISNVNATDATRVTTEIPFVPSSLRPRILISSTTSTPTASDMPFGRADDTKVSPTKEEITSLVRIDIEGSWYDVCPKIGKLKPTLAEILTSEMNKLVSDTQIRFHQDPCQESPTSTPTPSDMPMMSILVYVVDENGEFDSSMTKILPSLYEKSQDRITFPVKETVPDSGNAIAVVVVSSVAFICLVLLAGLLFIMRKRQTRFNYGERCRPVSLDAYSLDSVSAYNSVRRKGVARSSKRSYGNPTFEDSSAIPSHPLNFAGLSSFCNDVNAINEEFSGIPQVSAKIDELPAGAEVKNRYANVIPLPETRVPLQKVNNDPLTEYINASYVRGPKNATRYYIACQAPMESTVTDFWRMIWEQQCKVIIMLTDLVENGVEKCTEYVPPSEITDCHRLYGDYQVTLKKRETKEKYAISMLHLKNLENNTFREVYHIWYLWPVDGAQSDGAGLIAVLLEARALQRGGPGPIVVHCSPGTGRTGTLIALDLGIRQYEITRTVDVPRVVYTIRRDRAGAVQTKEQYAFIYKALNLYATKLAGGVLEST